MSYPANLTQSDIDEVVAASRKRLREALGIVITAIGPGISDRSICKETK